MKNKTFRSIAFSILCGILVGGIILAANQFPTTLNNWQYGDVIEEGWANALETKIGINNSAVVTSLDYLIKTHSQPSQLTVSGITNLATTTVTTLTVSNAFNLNGVVGTNIDMNGGLITNIAGSNFVSGGGLNLAGNLGVSGTSTFTGTSTFSGRVGIGQPSPDYTLDVNGTLRVVNSTILATTTVTNITASAQSKARAYASTSASIATSTFTKVLLEKETFDTLGEFDPVTNHRFTAQTAGYYQVNASVLYISVEADKTFAVVIYKNGSNVANSYSQSAVSDTISASISDIIYLAAGNYLELYTYHTATAARTLWKDSENVWMSIYKLP